MTDGIVIGKCVCVTVQHHTMTSSKSYEKLSTRTCSCTGNAWFNAGARAEG